MSNSDGRLQKLEKDFAPICDEALPAAEELALVHYTNHTRDLLLGGDMLSNARVLVHIVRMCFRTNNLTLLNENIVALSKKHGALKQAIQKMVQEAVTFVDQIKDKATKLELIDTLRTVTEGKIYVEVERARLTRILAGIREADGDIPGAADILQELQVETFGSMEKREKTDFLLEQMRLCLARVLCRRCVSDLKLRFYELMIQHALQGDDYLAICKYYREVYNTDVVKADALKWKEILTFVVIFIILSPFDNEQSDLTHRIAQDSQLSQIPILKEFLKLFMTPELMRWPRIEEVYGSLLRATYVFSTDTEDGRRRWKDFHHRVIEHNLRVVAKYYTRISFARLKDLLDLDVTNVEDFLSRLPRNPDETLAEWSNGIHRLLKLVETTTHLIAKEEMVHQILARP
ncbi:hypothetical protein BCR44DRAFT_1436585 [Catenaria anguillulae PL171]|uniref:PCI domain-containing protein n=1 Tax=Catenaria anguillulae PL171 TaxID=765915 RepID=A0A1Y2HK78_9FUNG|nr:hypothetical protein BCR44DRAFT_1436585 [Catenaria anguillulae PL171]